MPPSAPLSLSLLGGVTLTGGRRPDSRRLPVAVLVLLATAPSLTLSRTKLVTLLWPDADEATGRNRLTSTLYHLRRRVGADTVVSTADALRLEASRIDCDVWRFREALEAGDAAAAARAYRGPFLDGFFLAGSTAFDERVEQVRHHLRQEYLAALERLAGIAEAEGDAAATIRWWRERAAADPFDTRVLLRLMDVLAAEGKRADALRLGERQVVRMRDELGVTPRGELLDAIEELRAAGRTVADGRKAIAVLPFEELGGTDARDLAEGLHTSLLARLAEVAGLAAIARTTMVRYRNAAKAVSAIGRELGVDWVLEGDVREAGGRFLLHVRLIEARLDRQVWSREYGGDVSVRELFQIQADTTDEILRHLKLELSPAVRERMESRPTDSIDAYRLWAQGQMRLDRRSREEMQQAVRCFEDAIALDPAYAQAWVGLADALGLLHAYGYVPGSEVLGRAEEAIATALELAPDSAEAHAARARLLGQHNRAREAQEELEKAVELKPGYAQAHSWLSVGDHVLGRPADALEHARRALELNPLSPEVMYNLASAHLINGQPGAALREARRIRELTPSYESGHFLEGLALFEMGKHAEAAAALEGVVVPWAGQGPQVVRALALAASGDAREALRLSAAIDRSRHLFDACLVLAGMGRREEALDCVREVVFDGLDFWTSYWPTVATRYLFRDIWRTMEGDRRYHDMVERMERSWGDGGPEECP